MTKMGRPKALIDWKQIDAMLSWQCTNEEIACFIGVCEDTLTNRCKSEHGVTFSEYSRQKREGGKVSLRRAQYKKAVQEKSNVMLIWLGKQMLGQKDKQEITGDKENPPTFIIKRSKD